MSHDSHGVVVSRRGFAFWLGLGLFQAAEALGADHLDAWAAQVLEDDTPLERYASSPEHWTPAENNAWTWFERENLVDGHWKPTGITTPIHKTTGERFTRFAGYLDDRLVPEHVRNSEPGSDAPVGSSEPVEIDSGRPSKLRRARHGRPPSRWLRKLNADELRVWLKTIDVPEADVSGMTFWEHLTRDHSFDPARIEGLEETELAMLHSAAHYGY